MTALEQKLYEALHDMRSGWRYVRETHGDLYGVGWDRCERSASEAIAEFEHMRDSEKNFITY